MNTLTLKINEKSVVLKFGYGLFRLLGDKWELPGINSVMARFEGFANLAQGGELTFDLMDVISDLVISAAEYNDKSVELDSDEICDYFFKNVHELEGIMKLFVSALPQDLTNPDLLGKEKEAKPKK